MDNLGEVFLSDNDQVSVRTKHIDVRYHFVKDLRLNEELSVKHICGENNTSDILTKNLDVHTFKKHADNLINGNIVIFLCPEPAE